MILIYNDAGVSKDSVDALTKIFPKHKLVCGADIQKNNIFNNVTLFIMPGGRSLPYYEKLGSLGNQNIIQFVAQGGCYLGLCAGAYYACAKTNFAEGLPLEIKCDGALNFFEGAAIGPAFLNDRFAYQTENGACEANILGENGREYSVYFNGGCYFENANHAKNTKILAKYTVNQKAAAIECQVGKGCALLFGVHPELTKNMMSWIRSPSQASFRMLFS